MTIFLTDNCNSECTYCYTGDYKETHRTVPYEFATSAIDFFLRDQLGPCSIDKVRFYALGEPTLEMVMMKNLHAYASKVGPRGLSFELQTNGVFRREDAEWIARNIDMVWISLDGPPEIHDAQRPLQKGKQSSPVILHNIEILKKGSSRIGLRPTITRLSINRMKDILEYAYDLGVASVYFHYSIKPQGKHVYISGSLYEIPLIEFAQRYIEDVVSNSNSYGSLFVGNFLTVNFDEEKPIFCRSSLPSPHLTVDGYISCCDKAPLGSEGRFSSMIFGHWDEINRQIQIDPSMIEYLQKRRVDNMIPCNTCSVSHNCGGGCMGESNFLHGDIYKPVGEYCQAVRFLADRIPRNPKNLFPFTHP